jgi:hypothetical protein
MPEMEIRARRGHPDLLDLPWHLKLVDWDTGNTGGRLVRMAHGVSRHVVRFVQYEGRVYALKSTEEALARREYDLLRSLADARLPVVEAVGMVTGRIAADGEPLGAVLITRYLDFALPYRYLFGNPTGMDLRPGSSTPASCCWPDCTSRGSSGATARSTTSCSGAMPEPSWRTWSTRRPVSTGRRSRTACASTTSRSPGPTSPATSPI